MTVRMELDLLPCPASEFAPAQFSTFAPAPVSASASAALAPAPVPAPHPALGRAPASKTAELPLCAVVPDPASKTALVPWITISEPDALEDHEGNLKLLQAKYKLVCQVDEVLQKHMDGVRDQQKHWRLALDAFMLEAEDKCKTTVAATAKVMSTSAASEGRHISLASVPEVSIDWAAYGGPSSNGTKQVEDLCQKSPKSVDLLGLEYGGQRKVVSVDCFDGTEECLGLDYGGQRKVVSIDCLDGAEEHIDDVQTPKTQSTRIISPSTSDSSDEAPVKSNGNRASGGSKRDSISKASAHHLQRKKSCEDFSRLKKQTSFHHYNEERSWREPLQKLVHSTPFDGFVFFFIFANVLFVGLEVDYTSTHPGTEVLGLFVIANYVFAAVFTSELTIRLIALGCSFLRIHDNKDWAWNWFDVIVVMSSLVEIGADVVKTSSSTMDMTHFRVMRIIRVTRLLRTLRMVRMVRFIRALRTLLHSIIATMRAAIWSLLLLLIIFYGFGVGLTQAVMDYCDTLPIDEDKPFSFPVRAANCHNEALIEFWGTLPRSMFTLFKSVAGGVSWHVVVQPLADAGFLWVAFYVGFITFTSFAVLNVVTGLFCQSAIESAKQDKDIATMQLMASKAYHTRALEQLFIEMDVEHSGNLTIHEFQQSLENGRIVAYFESLEICCNDSWALFQLLDSDDEGKIDKDEFVDGCLQLRGNADAVSLAKMAYDNKIVHEMLEDFMEFMEDNITSLRNGTLRRPSLTDVQATGPSDKHSEESPSSHSTLGALPSGFDRQISKMSARRAPLSFNRQNSPKRERSFNRQISSRSSSKERAIHRN